MTSGTKAVQALVQTPVQGPAVAGTVGTAFNAAADALLGSVPGRQASALMIFSQLLQQMRICLPKDRRTTKSYPVIVIDEADKLKNWSLLFPHDLNALLGFFVAITNQERSAHVVLVTSDPSFLSWLSSNGQW